MAFQPAAISANSWHKSHLTSSKATLENKTETVKGGDDRLAVILLN